MNRKIAFLLFSIMFCASCRAQSDSLCVDSSRGVCRIPIDAVFFAREHLVGKNVGVQGVASIEDDGVFFYPDVESKKYRVRERAVRVIGSDVHLRDIEYMEGKRVTFVGVLGTECNDCWATIAIVNEPLEEPLPIKNYPAAPPPLEKQGAE